MFRWLGSHPEVMVAAKELRFFDGRNLDRGWDWYLSRFPEGGVTGEASPRYLTDARPQQIHAHLPDVKLIFVLREPVSRAYADYWMHRALGLEDRSFADALSSEAVWRRCVVTGEYERHLRRFRDVFGEERTCVLLLDDMEADPAGTFEAVCRYLGIEPLVTDVVGSVVNPRVGYRSTSLRRVSQRLPRLPRRILGRLNTTSLTYPPIDPDVRRRLSAHFAPHNAALRELLGRPIPWE